MNLWSCWSSAKILSYTPCSTNGLMHHQSNGNGGGPPPSNWPPTASPPSSTSSASATLPVKKKSVTIGTFTTVVEPFEEENMITSAVWHQPQRVVEAPFSSTTSAAPITIIPVDDELEAATRFNGSEDDDEDDQVVVEDVPKEVTEIWRKADGCESNPATELPDMALWNA